ncbi:tetratricopeptide repeat protein [Chloroflexia bacterium SDU3-3]|nr:tetratricopeptide repeat protein [Chloroflexia bacterium SDU3-3]
MSDDIAAWLYDGAVAVTEGRYEDAQALLMRVIEQDEQNELAWLWLSGAVTDAGDQQIALENVLAINPHNAAAQTGLAHLRNQQAFTPGNVTFTSAPSGGEWQPPAPLDEDDVRELTCWQCSASLYSVAQFCWQCHAAVHCCNNCEFRTVQRCKELQDLTATMAQAAQNRCEWWRPSA